MVWGGLPSLLLLYPLLKIMWVADPAGEGEC